MDIDNNKFESYNYIHICNNCDIILKSTMNDYYKLFELENFNTNIFEKQMSEYIEYQTLCFQYLIDESQEL